MLIKLRRLGVFDPKAIVEKNGELSVQADMMIGEVVKVPESLKEPCELMVAELTSALFPLGIEVCLSEGPTHLNGLWVQRAVLTSVRNSATAAA